MKFYVGGIYVTDAVFHNGHSTELNLAVNTTCGNGVCEITEDSDNCCDDCGCPSGYTCESNVCVEDTVEPYCGDGICNNGEDCSTCSVDCSTCPPAGGGGGSPPSGPYCGDGNCDIEEGETCSNCEADCGCCSPECEDDSDCDDGDDCTAVSYESVRTR